MTVAVSRAVGDGAEAVICASTGNTAASAAAYAARAGLRGAVIVPEGKIAIGKLAQALMHGARVIALRGNFDEALRDRPRARRARTRSSSSTRSTRTGSRARRPRPSRSATSSAGRRTRWRSRSATPATSPPTGAASRSTPTPRRALRLPGRRRGAAGTRPPGREPETVASAIRIGNPARWEEAMDAVTSLAGPDRGGRRRAILDAYRLLASARGSSASPPRPRRSPACSPTGYRRRRAASRRRRWSACSPATGSRIPTRRSARRRP